MNLFRSLTQTYRDLKQRKAVDFLCKVDPGAFMRWPEQSAVSAFQRVARRVPVYGKLLRALKGEPSSVTGIESFKKLVPDLDKRNTFREHSIPRLCLDGDLDPVKSLLTSSGHSGIFSFGVNARRDLKHFPDSIDSVLDYLFKVSRKRSMPIFQSPRRSQGLLKWSREHKGLFFMCSSPRFHADARQGCFSSLC